MFLPFRKGIIIYQRISGRRTCFLTQLEKEICEPHPKATPWSQTEKTAMSFRRRP